ncbi:hypothetical protein C0J09_14010 [Bordetella avium]|uniref:hypothetical protein n=1 Tax=Bordetella avium TaxID=521 RepID=UPI000FDC4FA2|nr:hypothetical protein [Bordetella avium]AZY50115.1 hypothetical protein C0J09_14010 [Bordetella avium]
MKPSDNEIEMLAAGFAIQHKNGLIRFAHALLEKHASNASTAADGRDGKDAARKTAGNIQEPMNGDGWHVVWWNESMRLMLPDGSHLDRFQGCRNGTMQLTIKTDAAIAAQQGKEKS